MRVWRLEVGCPWWDGLAGRLSLIEAYRCCKDGFRLHNQGGEEKGNIGWLGRGKVLLIMDRLPVDNFVNSFEGSHRIDESA